MTDCSRCKGKGIEPGPDEHPKCPICNSDMECPNPKYHPRPPMEKEPERPIPKEELEEEVLSKLNWLTKYVRYALFEKKGPPNLVELENVLCECEAIIGQIEQFCQSKN